MKFSQRKKSYFIIKFNSWVSTEWIDGTRMPAMSLDGKFTIKVRKVNDLLVSINLILKFSSTSSIYIWTIQYKLRKNFIFHVHSNACYIYNQLKSMHNFKIILQIFQNIAAINYGFNIKNIFFSLPFVLYY
jgi:hypothetical protein